MSRCFVLLVSGNPKILKQFCEPKPRRRGSLAKRKIDNRHFFHLVLQ
jgi:hypothetical protein